LEEHPVPRTVVVLTEEALRPTDAAHIAFLHPERDTEIEVLVPADTEQNVVASIIDHLGLLDLRAVWDDVVGRRPSPEEARSDAAEDVVESVAVLEDVGLTARGRVVEDDPLPDLAKTIAATSATELIVVTKPQMLEDTFHLDWAHRAREAFGIPVLHFYTGSEFVGS
jgi:hypothetical protein